MSKNKREAGVSRTSKQMPINSRLRTLYKTRSRSNSAKRAWFEDKTLCSCCYYPTLNDHGGRETCHICGWTDIGQGDADASEVKGGPNTNYSLREARTNFRKSFDMYRSSDVEQKQAMRSSMEMRKSEIKEFNRLLVGTKPEKICCELFKEWYETSEIVFAYAETQEIDETQWFVDGFAHLYYCPFCGEYIKGRGFGNYR
jgi:hypothetical protein